MTRFIPLAVLAALGIVLVWGLFFTDKLNATQKRIGSTLINKPAPKFTLTTLKGEQFSTESLKGKPWVLNVWASWCPTCVNEHPILQKMADDGIAIYGLNYSDQLGSASAWLKQHGNPYKEVLIDDGKVNLYYGVYGVPETFVIDKEGIIRHKFVGDIKMSDYVKIIMPLITEAKG